MSDSPKTPRGELIILLEKYAMAAVVDHVKDELDNIERYIALREVGARIDEHNQVAGHHKEWRSTSKDGEDDLGEYVCVDCERMAELKR